MVQPVSQSGEPLMLFMNSGNLFLKGRLFTLVVGQLLEFCENVDGFVG